MRKFRVGLVGAGGISEWHVEALSRVSGAEIVGICDLDQERAAVLAERLGVPAFGTLAELCDATAPDSIHVLTPPSSHATVALEAIERGCHVLIEKPLATSVEDCRRVTVAARKRGVTATVNHSLLFDPQVRRAVEAVRAGKVGRVISVDFLRGSDYPPYAGGDLPPHYRGAAYPFRDLGVHALYLFQEFLGPIVEVDAKWASYGGDPNLAYDEWRALVRCER